MGPRSGRIKVTEEDKASWRKLGAALGERRRSYLNKSQIALGADIGLPNGNFIGMIETGQAKIPFDMVEAYAIAYKCDIKKMRLLMSKYYEPNTWRDGVLASIEMREGEEAAKEHDKNMEELLKTLPKRGLF